MENRVGNKGGESHWTHHFPVYRRERSIDPIKTRGGEGRKLEASVRALVDLPEVVDFAKAKPEVLELARHQVVAAC